MAIPLVALMGRPADSVDQYSAGAMNAANIRKTEAEAGAAADGRKMQVFQQIGGALKGLEGLPPDQQAAGFERIKTLAMRTWGDNPDIASQIEPLTVQNLPDLYGMFTSYADQMKTEGQMAKDGAVVGLTNMKTADIGIDNSRADWKTGADIENNNRRTSIYGSGVANANSNRDAMTGLAYTKAERGAYGQLPDGYIMGDGGAQQIPGYTAPAGKSGGEKAPSGYRFNAEGALEFIPGGPADPKVKAGGAGGGVVGKLTEGQEKTVVYGNRAARAADALEKVDGALADYWENQGSRLPLGLGNQVVSEDFQKAQQYANEFLSAVLRKDTGAAITQQEMEIYGRTYLPQPGDGPDVLAQKREARRQAVADLKRGLGDRGGLIEGGNAPASPDSGVIEYDAEGNPL